MNKSFELEKDDLDKLEEVKKTVEIEHEEDGVKSKIVKEFTEIKPKARCLKFIDFMISQLKENGP